MAFLAHFLSTAVLPFALLLPSVHASVYDTVAKRKDGNSTDIKDGNDTASFFAANATVKNDTEFAMNTTVLLLDAMSDDTVESENISESSSSGAAINAEGWHPFAHFHPFARWRHERPAHGRVSHGSSAHHVAGGGGGDIAFYVRLYLCHVKRCNAYCPAPMEGARYINGGSDLAVVGRARGHCVAIFRGTSNLGNAIQDLRSLRMAPFGCPGCKVGVGILRAYKNVAGGVKGALRSMGCSSVAVVGHSLGAAMAIVALYDLSRSGFHILPSYTYGQPRTGNAAFHQAWRSTVHAPVFRVVHGMDPIVHTGPILGSRDHNGMEIYKPGHGGVSDHKMTHYYEAITGIHGPEC
eukprot:TRINITY_DN1311_c0_g1_i1.p1 TRINITY_DN1311_c0_g1~~TRINITY_DN1311_c0_g1_i1.p1  ORF type:complete len:352 (-),score=53.87 TRINITY_DN1311_c0_g1_i1:366-1421(-)